jgi:hypothetical protein
MKPASKVLIVSGVACAVGLWIASGSLGTTTVARKQEHARPAAPVASAAQSTTAVALAPAVPFPPANADAARLSQLVTSLQEQVGALEQSRNAELEKQAAAKARAEMSPEQQADAERKFEAQYLNQLDRDFEAATAADPWVQQATGEAWSLAELLTNGDGELDVECRSAFCRALITHRGEGKHLELIARASEQLEWTGEAYVTLSLEGGVEQTVIYLAKPGAQLPAPEHPL